MKDKSKAESGAEILAGDPVPGTDIALGGILATDVFALGGDFEAQDSSIDAQATRASAKGANGDEVANQLHDHKTAVNCNYLYKAASGSIDVDDLYIGKVSGGYHIDQIQVAYSSTSWPKVTVTGHNHDDNPHADASMVEIKPSLTLPAGWGVCPGLFANSSLVSSCVSANYTLSANHVDVLDCEGEHLAGDNSDGMEAVTAQYYGVPTLTLTGWQQTSDNATDSNADFDQTSINVTRAVARYVAP